MDFTASFKDRRVVAMTALGFASGVLCSFVYQLEPLWRELSVGISFGVIIGVYLFRMGLASPLKAIAFAVLTVLSWWAAERLAVMIFDRLGGSDFLSWQGLVTGAAAGLIGAGLLVLSAAAMFPFFRQPKLCLATTLAGGAMGMLMTLIDIFDTGLILFPFWQAVFAFCFALGFPASATIKPQD